MKNFVNQSEEEGKNCRRQDALNVIVFLQNARQAIHHMIVLIVHGDNVIVGGETTSRKTQNEYKLNHNHKTQYKQKVII